MGSYCCYKCETKKNLEVVDGKDGRSYYLCKSCNTLKETGLARREK